MIVRPTSTQTGMPMPSNKKIWFGYISILFGLIIFLAAYASLHFKAGLFNFNLPILNWLIDHRNPSCTTYLKAITSLMNPKSFVIIVGIITIGWIIIKREVYRPLMLVASIGTAIATSTIIKNIIHNARPPHVDMILPLETGFSFPSSHTISITILLLMLGYLIYSRRFSHSLCWLWNILSILAIAMIAFSRLYLGYHWLTDVVAAFGLGLAVFGIGILIDNIFTKVFDLNDDSL